MYLRGHVPHSLKSKKRILQFRNKEMEIEIKRFKMSLFKKHLRLGGVYLMKAIVCNICA